MDDDLLQSFPLPPSHIPSPNPPPSRPPSLPLPPIPGPSRINEHGTLLLLSSANHRHSSRYSDTNSISSIDINDIQQAAVDEDEFSPFPTARTPSPDIDSIISATPRLKKQSSASAFSLGVRSRKGSNLSTVDLLEGDLKYIHGTWDNDDDDDLLHGGELDDGDDTDSSIDLHTPLPHLMVKHGLLSPHSKLLPQLNNQSDYKKPPQRSLSVPNKKDSRDTPMRKERHRDGKLLRGGIGLTTGLGWSDSEDENAPSPLTRRLSTLNLSSARSSTLSSPSLSLSVSTGRRSSTATTNTTRSLSIASATSSKYRSAHPLARSFSGGATVYPDPLEDADEGDVNEWGVRMDQPPSSWNVKRTTGVGRRYPSSGSVNVGGRVSTSSLTSNGSSTNDYGLRKPKSKTTLVGSAIIIETAPSNGSGRGSGSGSDTTSTGLSLPVTPLDELSLSTFGPNGIKKVDKDKSLPPLPHHQQPIGILKKPSSTSSIAISTNTRTRTSSRSSVNANTTRTRTVSTSTTSTTMTTSPTSPFQSQSIHSIPIPTQLQVGSTYNSTSASASVSAYSFTPTSTSTSTSTSTYNSTSLSTPTQMPRPLQLPQRMASLSGLRSSTPGPGSSSAGPTVSSFGFSSSTVSGIGTGSGQALRNSVSHSQIGGGNGRNQIRSLNGSRSVSGLPRNSNSNSFRSSDNSYSNSISTPYSNSTTPTPMSTTAPNTPTKRKPRTGTGMVYRKSGGGTTSMSMSMGMSGIARSTTPTPNSSMMKKIPVPVPVPSIRSRVESAPVPVPASASTRMGMGVGMDMGTGMGIQEVRGVGEDGRLRTQVIGQAF